MSSGLQHKMYSYEVAPPSGVWEKIVAELDESELEHQFPSTLHNLSILPPVHAWQNITSALDESSLVKNYARKLGGIEVTPPVATWNKIATSLDADQETLVPQHRKSFSLLKYAAAAILIGFSTWGAIQLFNNKDGDKIVSSQNSIPQKEDNETISPSQHISTADENIAINDVAAALEEARNDAALEQSKKTFAKLDVSTTRSKIKNAANFFFIADDYQPTGTRSLDINDLIEPSETSSSDVSNRYIMLMTPDGNIIRMSKKFSHLVCCVSGEEQDKDCVDQMKKWREKIASPSSTHSTGNVMDILSLVNSLQDN